MSKPLYTIQLTFRERIVLLSGQLRHPVTPLGVAIHWKTQVVTGMRCTVSIKGPFMSLCLFTSYLFLQFIYAVISIIKGQCVVL
jgi:hypothetical protein